MPAADDYFFYDDADEEEEENGEGGGVGAMVGDDGGRDVVASAAQRLAAAVASSSSSSSPYYYRPSASTHRQHRDAALLLSQTTVRDARKLRCGRVTYLCWCDENGHVVDDGTLTRLEQDHFRLTSNAPNLAWFGNRAHGLELSIEDSTESWAALALQGPRSRTILEHCVDGGFNLRGGAGLDGLFDAVFQFPVFSF